MPLPSRGAGTDASMFRVEGVEVRVSALTTGFGGLRLRGLGFRVIGSFKRSTRVP